jgi:glutamyl/glutaminyl-tRNA synthetase
VGLLVGWQPGRRACAPSTALEFPAMDSAADAGARSDHPDWCATDVEQILRERRWLSTKTDRDDAQFGAWLERAAALLGPHAKNRLELITLLEPVFCYDAADVLRRAGAQQVLARTGAREVIRELANEVLASGEVDSDRFKQVVQAIKAAVPYRSRALFHPIRLALTGRAGEGELDRVILLLDAGAKLRFAIPVKGVRARIIEFCSALD